MHYYQQEAFFPRRKSMDIATSFKTQKRLAISPDLNPTDKYLEIKHKIYYIILINLAFFEFFINYCPNVFNWIAIW